MMVVDKIAKVVVLYIPQQSLQERVASYSAGRGTLYVFDNSPVESKTFVLKLLQLKNVQYLTLGRNVGIAKALNVVAKNAYLQGYKYLLTMDQDSYFTVPNLDQMISLAMSDSRIGIVSPVHIVKNDLPEKVHGDSEELLTTMTSGNLLNLEVWNNLGGFDEKLFIDYVDHEYCLRMKKYSYKVVRANQVILEHQVGELLPRKFLFWTVRPTNHSPFRLFYQTRNRFYLKRLYGDSFPEYFRKDRRAFWKSVLKILLYERHRIRKIVMICRGFLALWRNDFSSNSIL